MSKVMHVDGFVNLSHLEEKQFHQWIEQSGTKENINELIGLVENNADSRTIQRKLLEFEDKVLASSGDSEVPKDIRLEVLTEGGYVTLGVFDNGSNASCYVRSESFR